MSDGTMNEAPEGADEDFATVEGTGGEMLTPEAEAEVWKQATAGMDPHESVGEDGRSLPSVKAKEERAKITESKEGEKPVVEDKEEEEGDGDKGLKNKLEPTDLPSEEEVSKKEAEERIARLEAELAVLKNKSTDSEKKLGDPPKPEDFTEKVLGFLPKDLPAEKKEEVKTLLDYTEGLPTLLTALRESIRSEVFEQIKQDEVARAAKADESTKDAKFWEGLGTWFQSEYPEFKLEQIRADQKFVQWAKVNDAWISDQLNRVDRFDTSGARTVFAEYMKRAHPGGQKSPIKSPEAEKRKAAARMPSSLGTRTSKVEAAESSNSVWDQEVAKLNAKELSTSRRYL